MASNEGSHRIDSNDSEDREDRDRAAVVDPLRSRPTHDDRADHPQRAGQYSQPAAIVEEQRVLPAKTSAAAAFALVFGLSALLAVLTIILAPLALVLSIIGIILGVIGMRMAKRVGVTGRGVAIGGAVLAVLALILSITVVAGVTTVLNNQSAVDRINKQVQKLQDKLPDKVEVPSTK